MFCVKIYGKEHQNNYPQIFDTQLQPSPLRLLGFWFHLRKQYHKSYQIRAPKTIILLVLTKWVLVNPRQQYTDQNVCLIYIIYGGYFMYHLFEI